MGVWFSLRHDFNDFFTYIINAKNRHVISSTYTTVYTTGAVMINIRKITVNMVYNSRRVVITLVGTLTSFL